MSFVFISPPPSNSSHIHHPSSNYGLYSVVITIICIYTHICIYKYKYNLMSSLRLTHQLIRGLVSGAD